MRHMQRSFTASLTLIRKATAAGKSPAAVAFCAYPTSIFLIISAAFFEPLQSLSSSAPLPHTYYILTF